MTGDATGGLTACTGAAGEGSTLTGVTAGGWVCTAGVAASIATATGSLTTVSTGMAEGKLGAGETAPTGALATSGVAVAADTVSVTVAGASAGDAADTVSGAGA